MGAFFEIQLRQNCHKSEPKELFLEIQNSLDLLEKDLSLYQSQSAIQLLNQTGSLTVAPDSLRQLVQLSLEAGRKTNGAFDLTVWPLLQFIKSHFKIHTDDPSDQALKEVKAVTSYKLVQLTPKGVQFARPGVKITLDGIAKGYAVDQVAALLAKSQVNDYLLNFSGNMKWSGFSEKNQFWKISRWNSVTQKAFEVPGSKIGSIASSGPDFNQYSKGKKWHHLIDPRTLRPANFWVGTTVLGPSATQCDILSTAFFAMPESELNEVLTKNFPDYQVWTVDELGSSRHFHGRPSADANKSTSRL